MASSNHLTKALRPGAITVGDRALPYEFGGETRSAHKSVCNRSDRIDCLPNSPCSRLLAAEMPVPIFPASFVSGDHMTSFWPIRCKQPPPTAGASGSDFPQRERLLRGGRRTQLPFLWELLYGAAKAGRNSKSRGP